MKVLPAGLLWLVVAAAAALSLQSPTSSTSQTSTPTRATLSGTVTKDPGSEPVKKALIELIAESQSDGGNYTALTGADGGFRIENIVPGRYRLFVERSGFQEIDKHQRRSEGRVLTLGAGQELKDLVIRLQAAAVVEGRVTDEDGDPMPEAQVAVMRQTFVAGRSHWEQVGAERTNDLGDYRIPGLAAGSYFVSVTPPPDFRSLIETTGNAPAPHGGATSDKPAPSAYQATYYPGTRDRGQAAAIQLHAGDDFPANFSLTPGPSLTIRGSVVNLPPGTTAAIMLQSKDFSLVLNGAEMHKDGSFEIRDVSPGAYTIFATVDNAAAPMMARQALQIGTANVDGLQLAPQAGGSIRGRLRMEANSAARPDPSQMFLLLRSADGDDDLLGAVTFGESSPTLAHVSADGSFEWKDVSAGHYYVQLSDISSMPDWFLKSVAAGGRDAMDSGFTVNGGATTVDVLASANGARAEGVATNQKDEPVADAVVVAVPEARLRSRADRYRKAVTDQGGRFILRGLPPGEYTLYAWESVDGEAYYNPEFLKSYEGQGKALHVSEASRTNVQLQTIPAVEDQQ
jgi:Carboxypeptidase regulatory-like domain